MFDTVGFLLYQAKDYMFKVEDYLTIKYLHLGRDKTKGLDCWGLVLSIYKDCLNISLPDLSFYEQDWSYQGKNYIMDRYTDEWERIKTPTKFCLVLIKNCKNIVNHVGVYIGNNKFIHCSKSGVVISPIDIYWKPKIEGYFHKVK